MRVKTVAFLILTMILGLCSMGMADTVTFELAVEFSGASEPEGSKPWLTATIEDLVGGGVQITLDATNLVGSEYVSEWNFNVAPFPESAPAVTGSGFSYNWGEDEFKADGDGFFDLQLIFPNAPPADRFASGDTIVLTIENLTASMFNYGSVGGSKGAFYSAAHVQGIGTDGNFSGWIGDSNGDEPGPGPNPIPEPTSIILLGIGLVGIGIAGRLRRN